MQSFVPGALQRTTVPGSALVVDRRGSSARLGPELEKIRAKIAHICAALTNFNTERSLLALRREPAVSVLERGVPTSL
jgi:hypothetical protein